MRCIKVMIVGLFVANLAPSAQAQDGGANGDWMTLGVPRHVHQGSLGAFYLTGAAMGKCANVTPQYARFNMNDSHWKEMYALILYAASQGLSVDCIVDSGCGGLEVWVTYCRTLLQ